MNQQTTTITGTPKVAVVSNRIHRVNPVPKTSVISNSLVSPVSSTKTSPVKTKVIVKSRKRTSLDEFSHRKQLRPEVKAGFKIWLDGKNFAFDNEWEQLYDSYVNRKI